MPDDRPLLQALCAMLPPGAGAGWADPSVDYPLLSGESLPNATPSRLREFAAGRMAARRALAAIGLPQAAIPQGADRAPLWPHGIIGSITHTATACLATAASATLLRGLGIDLELDAPLDRELWDTILLPDEQIALTCLPRAARGQAAKIAFSAKEAAYKAQYPISRTLFGFEVMTVTQDNGTFIAQFREPIAPFAAGDTIRGRIAVVEGHLLTVAMIGSEP